MEVQQLEDTIEYMQERIAELEFQQEDEGWQRINSGDSVVEFTKAYLDRIVSRSRLYFLVNPLINRAVTLQADYVFAQGVHIQATDKEVNKVVQDFLDDIGNQREIIGHQARLMKEQTLMLDGNVFFLLFTDKDTGRVQVRSVLVDEIVDIITDPDDANQVWYYKREWYSRIVRKDSVENKRNVVLYPDVSFDPGPRKPKTYNDMKIDWSAPIYHVKVGGLGKSRYGVPEVYSALEWAKAHRQFLSDWATIVRAYAVFAFKITVAGGKNAVAATKTRLNTTIGKPSVENNPPSLPGSTFIRSGKDVDIEPIKTAGATTSAQDGRELRMMVAAALGIPDTFFGDVDVGNLATARTLDRPTELKYKSRQELWKETLEGIINYVIFWAAYAKNGPLRNKVRLEIVNGRTVFKNSEEDDAKRHIEVMFPPILEHSIIDRINAVANAVTLNGRQFAVDSPELAKLTLRLMLQALSVPDVDEIISKIEFGGQPSPEDSNNGRDARPTGI